LGVGKFAKTSWQENLGSNSTIALNQSIADSLKFNFKDFWDEAK